MGNENFENEDTEYQFHEDEDVSYEEEEEEIGKEQEPPLEEPIKISMPPKKKPRLTKKKLIALIIFAILGVLVIYKLVTLIFGDIKAPKVPYKEPVPVKKIETVFPTKIVTPTKKTEEELAAFIPPKEVKIEPATAKAEEKKEIDKILSITPEVERIPSEVVKEPVGVEKLEKQISGLQKKSDELKQLLDEQKIAIQNRLSSLESSVTDLRSGIEALEDNIQSLTHQVQKAAQLITASAKKQITMGAERAQKMRVRKKYFVEAVIPGRAWIRGADGSTSTVTVGDYIEGYGRVTSINAYNGTVTTSSGIKIYYGVNG